MIPDEKLTRALGVLESLYMGSEGIGAFLATVMIAGFGPRWTLLVAGGLVPAVAFFARHGLASIDVGVRVPAREMAILRKTDLFRSMPAPALERIARNLVPVDVAAGHDVVREGELGDRFYAIERGRVLVVAGGTRISELSEGQYFGEIALLHDVPRVATVTAESDLRLLALDRGEFLRAVTGQPDVENLARRVAASRVEELRSDDHPTAHEPE